MASDAELGLAFVARRQGTGAMPANRWGHVLSLELGWLSPAQAKAFVMRAQDAGLLVADGDDVRLVADWRHAEIPRRFRLDPEAPIEPPPEKNPFRDRLAAVAKAQGTSPDAVLAAVADKQERFGGDLSAHAALLLVAAEAGLEVREEAAAALDQVSQGT